MPAATAAAAAAVLSPLCTHKGSSARKQHDVPSDFAADSYMVMFPISYSLLNTNGSAEKPWAMEDVYADARAQFVGRE